MGLKLSRYGGEDFYGKSAWNQNVGAAHAFAVRYVKVEFCLHWTRAHPACIVGGGGKEAWTALVRIFPELEKSWGWTPGASMCTDAAAH